MHSSEVLLVGKATSSLQTIIEFISLRVNSLFCSKKLIKQIKTYNNFQKNRQSRNHGIEKISRRCAMKPWFEEKFRLVPLRIDPATCTSKSIIKIQTHKYLALLLYKLEKLAPFQCLLSRLEVELYLSSKLVNVFTLLEMRKVDAVKLVVRGDTCC